MPPKTAPKKTSHNTGKKDAKGRSIWKGPRGGKYVMSAGKKVKPATGRKPAKKTARK
jgi:PBCV-specific basic adaptor domain